MELETNDEIGSYRIVRRLGAGGMAAVYEVEHVKLGVRYALKTFTLDHGDVELYRKRRSSAISPRRTGRAIRRNSRRAI